MQSKPIQIKQYNYYVCNTNVIMDNKSKVKAIPPTCALFGVAHIHLNHLDTF